PDPNGCAGKSPGKVVMGGAPFYSDAEVYFAAGSTITVEAYPSSGWIFTGWGFMPGVPQGTTFIYSFTMNQPQVIHPLFQAARPSELAKLQFRLETRIHSRGHGARDADRCAGAALRVRLLVERGHGQPAVYGRRRARRRAHYGHLSACGADQCFDRPAGNRSPD